MIYGVANTGFSGLSFEEETRALKAAGWENVELNLNRTSKYLHHHTPQELRSLYEKAGLSIVAGYGPTPERPGVFFSRENEWERYFNDYLRPQVLLCEQLGCRAYVVTDQVPFAYVGWVPNARQNLRRLADFVNDHGMTTIVEFNYTREASRLTAMVNRFDLGWCVDSSEYVRCNGMLSNFEFIDFTRLSMLRLSDVAQGYDMFTMTEEDKLLPGEGCLPLHDWVSIVKRSGFDGMVMLDVNNALLNAMPPEEAAKMGLESLKKYV